MNKIKFKIQHAVQISKETLRLQKLKRYHRARQSSDGIFVWIPKNAGSSTYAILFQHGLEKYRSTEEIQQGFVSRGLNTFNHMDLSQLVEQGWVRQGYVTQAFKFAFSRNPYSRTVSLFRYLQRKGWTEEEDFLSFCRMLTEVKIPDIGLYNVQGYSQCNAQVRWLEGINLDFIGRVESYQTDLNRIVDRLGLPAIQDTVVKNVSTRSPYQEHYCEETRQIVQHIYARDFRELGYDPSQL